MAVGHRFVAMRICRVAHESQLVELRAEIQGDRPYRGSGNEYFLTRERRDALVGREDAAEVQGVGRGNLQRLTGSAAAHGAKERHRLGHRVLLAVETGHEAAAAHVTSRLEGSQDAHEVAPR